MARGGRFGFEVVGPLRAYLTAARVAPI
jgi:hypothetical protein